MNLKLRKERARDPATIHELTAAAFGREVEAVLVDLARERGEITWSIVAEDETNEIVGHVMVSPMSLEPDAGKRCLAIGPVSVKPELQTMGIGTALMMEAIHRGRDEGYDAILLLGNPRYYHRFGFATAPVGNEYGASEEFMALELHEGSLKGAENSVAKYVSAFADAESTATD